jgi:hypothetical protein
MTKQALELAAAVLRDNGKLSAEETIASADSDYIIGKYRSKLEDWREEGLVYWSYNEIPEVVFDTLSALVWNEVSNAFGVRVTPEDRVQRETILLRRLRRHMGRSKSGFQTKAVFY